MKKILASRFQMWISSIWQKQLKRPAVAFFMVEVFFKYPAYRFSPIVITGLRHRFVTSKIAIKES